jgi:uncharacterized protein
MQKARPDPQILVIDDGIKGNFNQAYGIASSFLGARVKTLRVSLRGPFYRLPGRKGTYPLSSKMLAFLCLCRFWNSAKKLLINLVPEARGFCGKKFDLVISAGSVLAPVNLLLTKETGAKSVNVMIPSLLPLNLFDYPVIPYHDSIRLKGKRRLKNLIVTFGAPNTITDKFLKEEKERLKTFINIPEGKKSIGVIIGGKDQNYDISVRYVKTLIAALKKLEDRYSLLFTTSRRTPEESVLFLREKLEKKLKNVIYAEFPGYSVFSHYPGMLALCDFILVTEDSINMVSEATSAGVPVIILGVEREKTRRLFFDYTIEKFVEKGYAEYLSINHLDKLPEKLEMIKNTPFKKLNEAEECARKISKTLT